jgi:hypothetical protein
MSKPLLKLSMLELRSMHFRYLRVWPALADSKEKIVERLTELSLEPMDGLVYEMRKELMSYIVEHREELALRCNGDCRLHTDQTVVACYMQLLEAKKEAEDGKS